MMQTLGYIFTSLIISTTLVVADYFLPGTFLDKFIEDKLIETLGVLVGLNITAVVFMLGQTAFLENNFRKSFFEGTKKEIKESSFLLLFIFCSSILLLIFSPDLTKDNSMFSVNVCYYLLKDMIVALFTLALMTIFEILNGLFKICNIQTID